MKSQSQNIWNSPQRLEFPSLPKNCLSATITLSFNVVNAVKNGPTFAPGIKTMAKKNVIQFKSTKELLYFVHIVFFLKDFVDVFNTQVNGKEITREKRRYKDAMAYKHT